MVKPTYTVVLIQHHIERILQNKFVIPEYHPVLLQENYTEEKRDS